VRGETILVIDDELPMRLGLAEVLSEYDVETAATGEEGIARIDEGGLDVVITDLRMPGKNGMDVLRHTHTRHPDVLIFMISAHGDVPTAVEAMKHGARDFIQKPFDIDDIRARIRAALDSRGGKKRVQGDAASGEVNESTWAEFPEILGRSAVLGRVLLTIKRIAHSPLPVLVLGETGTGKELVAQSLHRLSRREGPLLATTGQLPESLIESELFGHAKGSFTGASGDKPGYFESADGGTFFLDEVGDLPMSVQVKLLRAVQEKEVVRVGESKPRKINTRLVAATNVDLEEAVRQKRFREDLLYRLNVITLVLPPLRERGEDVLLLAEHFLAQSGAAAGREMAFSDDAKQALAEHRWPGNVRELKSMCESLSYLAENDVVAAADIASV
jgi:DNA-binding NtrC family response regulator